MAMAMAASNVSVDPYLPRTVKGHPFKPCEEMKYEGIRLTTFKDWPGWGSVWPTVLAKAGFFYTKTADQVACFCCGGRLKTWEAGDSPMTEHKRFFPTCRFVTGQDSTNVPLGEAPMVPSGGHGGCTSAKTNYYSKLAKQAAAGHSEASGPSSLNHLTQATMRPHCSGRISIYSSLQCDILNSMAAGGLSMVAGGRSMATGGILSLTIEQLQAMKLESKRLESFSKWPTSAYGCPDDLAKTGLFYFGNADHVRCAFCMVTLRDWKPDDDPAEVHQNSSSTCAFLKDAQAAGNVSIEEERINNRQSSQNAVANPQPSLGVVRAEEPKSLNYSGETSRLLSFRRWPQTANQTADDLARAGFYYTGIEDSVKCFSCNGTLRNWEREDDAWTEHARWFPRCNYVRTVKGEPFIRSVQAAHSGQRNATRSANDAPAVTQSTNTGARTFPVEPRMIRARMDTTRVRSVLDMGFTRDLVYDVIKHRLTTTGDDFPNVQTLLEAVFAAEEALPSSSSSLTRNTPSNNTPSRTSEPPAASNAAVSNAAVSNAAASNAAASNAAAGAATPAAGNQAPTAGNASPKGKKKRRKNKPATGSNGTKTSVSATEPSLSLGKKTEEKLETTEDQRLQCKICMDAEAKIVFLPCGHLCSCATCAPALRNCPICRALIRGTVRVFLS
ncbi:hypothetical protein NP493_354g00014 [Ridgeia piscesae]|uniref:RING-type domain-containing protein n=1 Tax=Ridgeia piscesae TaxID=27915 RepID=A0AAD9L4D1_RIDPI|nr:hypothetical protein NP493_354g00014 [Ridgeia piscesae]